MAAPVEPGLRGEDEPFDRERHCHDCGRREHWAYASECRSYCRRCYEKNGHHSHADLDPDILEQIIGRELTMIALSMAGRTTLHTRSELLSASGNILPIGTRVSLNRRASAAVAGDGSSPAWIVDVHSDTGTHDTVTVRLPALETRLGVPW